MPRTLYNCNDVAKMLGVSRQLVRNWYKREIMPDPFAVTGAEEHPLWTLAQLKKRFPNAFKNEEVYKWALKNSTQDSHIC